MRIKFIIILLLSYATLYSGDSKKAALTWKSFDDGLAEAKKKDKKILVDVYTDWCGWCKRMDRDTYSNDSVSGYLSQQFILVKLNAESDATLHYKNKSYSEMMMAQSFGVTGYPTILFLEPSGKHITSLPGYVGPDKFMTVATFIGNDHYKNMTWEEYNANLAGKGKGMK